MEDAKDIEPIRQGTQHKSCQGQDKHVQTILDWLEAPIAQTQLNRSLTDTNAIRTVSADDLIISFEILRQAERIISLSPESIHRC